MSERSSTRKTIFSHRKHGRALQGLTAGLMWCHVSLLHLAGVFRRRSSLRCAGSITSGTEPIRSNSSGGLSDSRKTTHHLAWRGHGPGS